MDEKMRAFVSVVGQIDGVYHNVAVQLGLSDSVFKILYTVCYEGEGCNQSALYKKTGLGKTTINSAVRKMEREKLLFLKPGKGRNTRVYLTQEGQRLIDERIRPVMEIENDIFSSWSETERDSFVALHRRYLAAFSERTANLDKRSKDR